MINFRFHLVSLVAVFLALTVGIVVGATIVNQAIVDGLNHRIDTVGKNADKQRTENAQLSAGVKQLESYLQASAPYVVENRLTAVPVVVVAEQGVDRDTVRATVTLLQDGGAQSPAIVWMQSKWLLDKPADRTRLARIVNDTASATNLRADALAALADRLGVSVSSISGRSQSTATTVKPAPDLLDALSSAGFVSVEAVGAGGTTDLSTFPLPGARAVVIGGSGSNLAAAPILTPLVTAFAAIDVPTVAGDVYGTGDGQPKRGTGLAAIISDNQLDKGVSTVDDVDMVQGEVGVVLAAADSGEGNYGHYGYGKGADRALPTWAGL